MKYKGKEIKFIKDYGDWILFEHGKGYKEGIHKHDLGLISEIVKPPKVYINPERVFIYRTRRNKRRCD